VRPANRVLNAAKRQSSLLVAISYLVFLAIGLYAGLMGVVWPSMRDSLRIDDDAYGVLAFATTVGSLLVIANVGRLIERVGTGRLLALGCALGYQMTAVRLGLAAFPALGGVLIARLGVSSLGPYLLITAIVVVVLNELTVSSAAAAPPRSPPWVLRGGRRQARASSASLRLCLKSLLERFDLAAHQPDEGKGQCKERALHSDHDRHAQPVRDRAGRHGAKLR
jgi:hypothetical protein